MIVLATVCGLFVALLTGSLVLYETKAMWSMDSPNAKAWNATLNSSATFGINVIPLLIVIIIVGIVAMISCSLKGF